jgi:hypothetical protein
LREVGHVVFDDWFAFGPEADDWWQKYEKGRGRTFKEALDGYCANNAFSYDKGHIDRSDAVILCAPAGKSAHLEFGYAIGKGTKGYILLDGEPERWDVMYRFATAVCFSASELQKELEK